MFATFHCIAKRASTIRRIYPAGTAFDGAKIQIVTNAAASISNSSTRIGYRAGRALVAALLLPAGVVGHSFRKRVRNGEGKSVPHYCQCADFSWK
ncbi:MAG TPA: hypothetical protein VFE60_05080 [Roseiarcus sp.]|jgi:hypothetical protein|nr:hypothetical protein [Roseiarcus sp.]